METLKFYNYKIAALSRSVAHLIAIETPTESQVSTLKTRKKDLMVYKGKRTKLVNSLTPSLF